ncbi:MAG TPA: hypothetical protein VFT87_05530 [Candidatus Saccharimonadales bacterium]|nr:hypothetical protein [Candidatus Saccharimonadales bacterium]
MNHDCPNNKAAVVNGEYRTGCDKCLNTRQQSSLYARKYARDRMKEDYRGDMLQRYDGDKVNPEWVKMHEDKAREDLGQETVEEVLRG